MTVTIFGDSIMRAVLYEDGRYRKSSAFERLFSDTNGIIIRNLARFGCTIRKAIPWIRQACETAGTQDDRVLLEFGGNDCNYDWEQISREPSERIHCKTPPEEFASLYREAITRIRQSGRTPVAMSLPPIHSVRYLNFICKDGLSKERILQWLGDAGTIGIRQRMYSDIVMQIAKEEQAEVVDVRNAFPKEESELVELLCEDGIHPNQKGQSKIFAEIREAFLRIDRSVRGKK